MTEDTKLCPYCAEEIKAAAIVCKHCGRELPEFEDLKPATSTSHFTKLGNKVGQPIPKWIGYFSNTYVFLLIYFLGAFILQALGIAINTIIGFFFILLAIHFWAFTQREKYLSDEQREAESDMIYHRRGP